MKAQPLVITLGVAAFLSAAQPAPRSTLVERVGDTGFIQLEAKSFAQLDARHQALAYWLSRASIAIDPIIYDQLSAYGLRQKRLIEEILSRPSGIPAATLAKIRSYALLFWANRGNHNEITAQKFLPTFTAAELEAAALRVQANGGFKTAYADLPALADPAALKKELVALQAATFDSTFEPMATAKTPRAGQGHPAGELEHVLPGRRPCRSDGLSRAVSPHVQGRQGTGRRHS